MSLNPFGVHLHNIRKALTLTAFLIFTVNVSAQLRCYTMPYRVFSGDPVRFIYFETTNTVAKTNIASWAWDFDGNGTFDAQGTNVAQIDQTWYATYDATKATHGVQYISPVLCITTFASQTFSVTNITEDTHGGDQVVDPFLEVQSRAAGNGQITINFSANPRLAVTNAPGRFYSDIQLQTTGRVDNITWNFGDGGTATGSNPQHSYTTSGVFSVAMTVNYRLTGVTPNVTNSLTRTNFDFVRAVQGFTELSLGRAYRRGFP